MGFDNECILNIQSLAGEYFCPVCRLLVYPNEALQSQCTHLYCKPCLTYIAGTTRACPYDGYLVTEADSKPLLESNKAVAETIGKITVHCLYHKSGCTWQGSFSECTAHCSGCAFGNSPVVCNRCGLQIVHRQVLEHAQNCPSVQPQAQQVEGAQNAAASGTSGTGDQTLAASQAGTTTSQAQTPQTSTATTAGQDLSQQTNLNSQAQAVTQAVVVTSEQWYQQQQQQYQQYYQQYPGYDPYYQQYYPYQQQAIPQYQQQLQVPAQQMAGQHQAYIPSQPQAQPQLQLQPQVQPQVQSQPQLQAVQPQTLPSVQAPVMAQPQQAQVVQQPQPQPVVLPHSQMPSQTQPPSQSHSHPQVQPYPVPQPQPHLQVQPQTLTQPQSQPHSQVHPTPNQPLNPNFQPQMQHPSANAVTGHQSYPQPQSHQQMPVVASQPPMHMPPQVALHPQLQHPVHIQTPYSQQPPQIRPPQPHAAISNQHPPSFLLSPGPPPQQQVNPNARHPGLPVNQRPGMLPVPSPISQQYVQQQPISSQQVTSVQNQMPQQAPIVQQQLPVQPQLRPQGLHHSFQQHSHAYPQQQQNLALSQGVHLHPSQNLVGRPLVPTSGVQSQQYPESAAGMQVKPAQLGTNQLSPSQKIMPGTTTEKNLAAREVDSSSWRAANLDTNNSKREFGIGADAGKTKTPISETDLKTTDEKAFVDVGEKSSGIDPSMKEKMESKRVLGSNLDSNALETGDPVTKKTVKEESTEDPKDIVEHRKLQSSVSEDKKVKDGPLMNSPPLQEGGHGEEQSGKLQKDKILPQDQGAPKRPGADEFRGFLQGQGQPVGNQQHSHSVPTADQGRNQPPLRQYTVNSPQQRPILPGMLQGPLAGPPLHAQTQGLLPGQLRPQGPGHAAFPGPPENLPPGLVGRGPSYGSQGPAFDSYGTSPYGPESQFGQHYMDGRRPDSSMLSKSTMKMNGPPGLDSTPGFGFRDERLKPVQDEQSNPFPLDPALRFGDGGRFEDVKHFPRSSHFDADSVTKFGSYFSSSKPLDRGPHGFGMDVGPGPREKGPHGLPYDPAVGSGPSRFLPPYHPGGRLHPDEAGERSVGFHEDTLGRLDFHGPVPGYGQRHMDGFASRSPGREYLGIHTREFRSFRGDDIDGRESRFNDRFPGLGSHSHNGDNLPIAEHLRSGDLIGQDIVPSHLRRGEHLGPRNLPGHLRFGEPVGLGPFSGHERIGEFGGPGNFRLPRLGEPGFRSSFSLQGLPTDGGSYADDMVPFDRRRKPASVGWCRICKVDCETVEGLDMHSQSREHQKNAMDMVATIKQNAKKQKITTSDRSVHKEASKLRNAKFEGRGTKH
ncbi:hypothetical protein SLA2020_393050 [Shorea laevis]